MVSPHTLAKILADKGVDFLVNYDSHEIPETTLTNAELLSELASQEDARLRLALIPIFLCSPEISSSILDAIKNSPQNIQFTLKVYYTASYLLSKIYQDQVMQDHLSNQFIKELDLSDDTYSEQLDQLGNVYQIATNLKANWVGMFHHAAQRVIQRNKKELEWGIN